MEDAAAAWRRGLAKAEAALESRERELESRDREVGLQREQIADLDRVATRLANMVADHKQELRAVREELAEERRRGQEKRDPGATADDAHEEAPAPSGTRRLSSVGETSSAREPSTGRGRPAERARLIS